jgi:hypothetical protein
MPAQQKHHKAGDSSVQRLDPTNASPSLPSFFPGKYEKTNALGIPLADEENWANNLDSFEVHRFSDTLTYLVDTYDIAKRHAVALTSTFRSVFVLSQCSEEELLNCDGVGIKVYEKIETNPECKPLSAHSTPPVFSPPKWKTSFESTSHLSNPDFKSKYQLHYQHQPSDTTLSVTKVGKNVFVPALQPPDTESQGIVFNPRDGMRPINLFKFIDIICTQIPQEGYRFNNSYGSLGRQLSTDINFRPPTPDLGTEHSEGTNTIILRE